MFIGLSLSITGRLRSSASALSIYAVNGFDPAYVTDFGAEFYRKSGATSTFSDSITHSAASNATMVDSDGLLKWRPHNLLTYSEDFTHSSWVKDGILPFGSGSVVNATTAPDGTESADFIAESSASGLHRVYKQLPSSTEGTRSCFFKYAGSTEWVSVVAGTGTYSWFNIRTGTVGTVGSGVSASITSHGNGWYECSVYLDGASLYGIYNLANADGATSYTGDGTSGIYIWGAHLYRSDLGGMVNNPDRGDSYVPTTTSAVYLPRRGHHVYNGDSWVNKGLLHESEQRVNLVYPSTPDSTWIVFGDVARSYNDTGTVSPDGNNNATKLTASGTTKGVVYKAAGGTYRSVFAKAGTASYLFADYPANLAGIWFDLVNGEVGTDASGVARIEDYGNGWYRCCFPIGNPNFAFGFSNADGVDTQTIGQYGWVYGAQAEDVGSTPSSYIPTSGATVTRSAETLTVPAANLPWPSPVVIGEELFDPLDLSTWSNNGGVSSKTATTFTVTSAGGVISPDVFDGSQYQVSVSFAKSTSTEFSLRIDTTLSSVDTSTATSGTLSYVGPINSFIYLRLAAADTVEITNISVKEINPLSVSIQMQGEMTYADEGVATTATPFRWFNSSINYIDVNVSTFSTDNGKLDFRQNYQGVLDKATSSLTAYPAGVNVPFNIASRHGSTFINGAVDGTALTADTTPVALPDLSATDLQLGYDYMGTISLFRVWADDLTDAGIAEAST